MGGAGHHPVGGARPTSLAKLITQDEPSASALLLLFLFVGLGAVGFLDDYIKISKQRSLGLRSKAKMIGQTVVARGLRRARAVAAARGRPRQTPASHARLVHPRLRAASRCRPSW